MSARERTKGAVAEREVIHLLRDDLEADLDRALALDDERDRRLGLGRPREHTGKGFTRVIPLDDRWVERDEGFNTRCWVWVGPLNASGYGVMSWRGRNTLAHRAFYQRFVGSISDGLQLDHLCRVRACVNPNHLEPVTHTENVRRGCRVVLTAKLAAEIRDEREALVTETGQVPRGARQRIAEKYGITPRLVSAVWGGEIWAP